MEALDFIGYWRAQPFRPFIVVATDGRLIPVTAASQVAMAPNMARFTIETDSGPVSLRPAEITACQRMEGAEGEAVAAGARETAAGGTEFRISPGGIELKPVRLESGDWIVETRISCADGTPFFSTSGTQWDVHGLETFENGRTLYLHHPRDPFRTVRVIVWPPGQATLETFAEAKPPGAIERELKEMEELISEAGGAGGGPPERYWKEITPPPPPPEPKNPPGGPWDRDDPGPRYALHIGTRDAGPHHWTDCPKITDTWSGRPVLDLWDTSWDAHAEELGGDRWRLTLRHFPQGGVSMQVVVDAAARTATVEGTTMPLAFFEAHLMHYPCYAKWDVLMGVLRGGPRSPREAWVVLPLAAGWTLELWPVEAGVPLLTARLVAGDGRCILDLRGSRWGAVVRPWDDKPKVSLRLINADPEDRSRMETVWFTIDLPSRRIVTDEYKGSTATPLLQHEAHASRSWSGLMPSLTEAFERGSSLPVPE